MLGSAATPTCPRTTGRASVNYTHDFNVPQGVFIENAGRIYETSLEVVGSLLTVRLPPCPGTLPSTTTWDVAQDWGLFTRT
jgi:hypothetical protein